MLQKAASSPVSIVKSNGYSKSLSANFRVTDLTSSSASSSLPRLEWRRRSGNTCPAVKKSCSGRRGCRGLLSFLWPPHLSDELHVDELSAILNRRWFYTSSRSEPSVTHLGDQPWVGAKQIIMKNSQMVLIVVTIGQRRLFRTLTEEW